MPKDDALKPDQVAWRQLPGENGLVLDHLAHWVPDLERANADLKRLGFCTTPHSEQCTETPFGHSFKAGAANRCVMLEQGYLEVLTPSLSTAIGEELQAGIERYTGVHLLAFGCRDSELTHNRLKEQGFVQRPLVYLRREVHNVDNHKEDAKFTVTRAAAGVMPEGRVQCLTHHTPHLLWQPRYMCHPNSVTGLTAVLMVVEDKIEASARYARYLGLDTQTGYFPLERGYVLLFSVEEAQLFFGITTPTVPYILGYQLSVRSIATARYFFKELQTKKIASRYKNIDCFKLPESLGGYCFLQRH